VASRLTQPLFTLETMEMRFHMPSCRLPVDVHGERRSLPREGRYMAEQSMSTAGAGRVAPVVPLGAMEAFPLVATVIALAIGTRPRQSPVASRPRVAFAAPSAVRVSMLWRLLRHQCHPGR
jgi:hypothetical protein